MNPKDFDMLARKRFVSCLKLLQNKSDEYSRGQDKLHNFRKAAKSRNITPERALDGMMLKHLVSIDDIINDIDNGKIPTKQTLSEKITDIINYLVLLEALITERIEEERLDELYGERYLPGGKLCQHYLKD